MKELRARVEDVSQRNLRYQLIKGSKPPTSSDSEHHNITAAAIFGIDEARRAAAKHDNVKVDLVHLLNMEDNDLRVIALWGTSGDLGQASIINEAYENLNIKKKFPCRAWVRVSHPLSPNDLIESLVKKFRSAEGMGILLESEKTRQELAEEFAGYVNQNSYLIVLNGIFTFEEWEGIRTCFPDNKKGSRIIVCSPQVEVARLCAGQESHVLVLKQLSADQTVYAFYDKGCQDQIKLLVPSFGSDEATRNTNEIHENQSRAGNENKLFTKSITRIKTMASAFKESQLIGREKEKDDIIKLILNPPSQELLVISVWGMGGLGKTTLVKDVYESQIIIGTFEKRACVTVLRPFIHKEFLKSLIMQLSEESFEKKGGLTDFGHGTRNIAATMGVEELIKELARVLDGKKYLIVLDDISSTTEWDNIIGSFRDSNNSCKFVVTTREEGIAKYCSEKQENIYKLNVLKYKGALDLLTRKVFKKTINMEKQHPELIEEAQQILKKCNGLPLAIVTIGGFLANQPKVAAEWRKLNEHISAELEMNPELEAIKTILGRSYDGLPYHLKSCFLYLSIFPEDHKVSRRRLTRRWTAEGYSRDIREKSAEEVADTYFMDLINRSMILPSQKSVHSRKGIDSCQVHDLMREISISKAMEEALVFRLEEGYMSKPHGIVRHLSISSNWKGDKDEYESIVDLSRVRSLTVFGKWRSFFISDKMRLVRILDLEGTSGLADHHLIQITKLFHLKYLSLRGCSHIFHLPDSIGNLRQLQTLDLEGTSIFKLPKTITKLRKLEYIRVSNLEDENVSDSYDYLTKDLPMLVRKRGCLLTMLSVFFCVACCIPQILNDSDSDDNCNRHDVCTLFCCVCFPIFVKNTFLHGVQIPRGVRKLKALHTMGIVNFTRGKEVIEEIKELSQLRKLAVAGISIENGQEFCSAVGNLSNLESLLVQSSGEPGLQGCLDGLSSPPKKLQSLKLFGNLIKLPEWINGFHNLVKLTLRSSKILELDATIEVLGKLPNLASLRLWPESFQGEDICFSFHQETFPSLMVLELKSIDGLKWVEFEEGAMLMLELLDFCGTEEISTVTFSGLSFIPNLKVFNLDSKTYKDDFIENLEAQLAENPNGPVLKRY